MTSPTENTLQELYRSLPLSRNSKCIRVLDVYAAKNEHEPITGDLHIVNLDEHRKFSALSYVWGIDQSSEFITLGNSTVKVTHNCYSALRHLRTLFGRLTIWVDAICINQANGLEKQHQLPLMGDIYTGADQTYVWLGEGDELSDDAMRILAKAGELENFHPKRDSLEKSNEQSRPWKVAWALYRSSWNHVTKPYIRDKESKIVRWLENHGILKVKRKRHLTSGLLREVLQRPWMSRIWTYQEILLGANPVIVCGYEYLTWSKFVWAIIHFDCLDLLFGQISAQPGLSSSTWRGVALARSELRKLKRGSSPHSAQELYEENEIDETSLREYHGFIYFCCRNYRRLLAVELIAILVLFGEAMHLTFFGYTSIKALRPNKKYIADLEKWDESAPSGRAMIFIVTLLPIVLLFFGWFFFFRLRRLTAANVGNVRSSNVMLVSVGECLLHEILSRQAGEEKDNAFGVHAILQRLSLPVPDPDYKLDKSSVYHQLAINLLQTCRPPLILVPASIKHTSGLSWVPDWGADFKNCWLPPSVTFDRRQCNASKGSKPFWELEGSSRLFVKAKKIWTVNSRTTRFQRTADSYSEMEHIVHTGNLNVYRKFLFMFVATQNDIIDLEQRLSNVKVSELIANLVPVPLRDGNTRTRSAQQELWSRCQPEFLNASPAQVLNRLEQSKAREWKFWNISAREYSQTMDYQIDFFNSMAKTDRILFSTSDPVYPTHMKANVGTCYSVVEQGDGIYLIAGVPIPLILRRMENGTAYRIISPAVIAGAMTGAHWDSRWKNEDLEELCIC
jgi:heterokaryon incompatibility protein (HET)